MSSKEAVVKPGKTPNYVAVAFLMLANVALTINQVNTAAIYNLIAQDFGQTVYGLGVITAAFFFAYGFFEVPGGIYAAKIGPRKLIIIGTLVNSISVIGSGFAPNFTLLVVSRFLAGLGFSFAFPSILVLLVRYFKAGSEGLGASMMFVSGGAGFILGFTPWVVLTGAVGGWRTSMLIAGLLDFVVAAGLIFILPPDKLKEKFAVKLSHLRSIIFSKQLAILSLALLGFGTLIGLTSNFTTYYLEDHLGMNPTFASSVTEVNVVLPMITSPLTGRLFDRLRKPKELILVAAVGTAVGVGLIGLDSITAAIAGVAIAGLATGVFSVGLIVAREIASANPEYESLTVAWVDSFSLYGNFVSPLYFSALVVSSGYPTAWIASAVIGLAMSAPILVMRNEDVFRHRTKSESLA